MSLQTDSLSYNSTLHIASDLDAMATVVEWFDQFNCPQLPYQVWIEGQTALIEGFTNVVRHAHSQLNPETPIQLTATIFSEYFQISIWDQGAIFDLEAELDKLNQKTSNCNFNPLAHEAHWGCIFLLKLRKDYGWNVSYTRKAGERNCLLLKKKITY
ncbi:anti-sigma regulatory factor [Nostoc sp. UCD121]|uniref:ATP-binding protein n=1 Tax=unclassified Nostoc TaxID=2593658 RepID=UPI001627B1FA|nr:MULTISPECIES: anti-sigma regulatory factor [unclassified Nostoc]MBC1218664.1 anti-sigma regulatory factor [Nostoc sp. UCD120]MBC1276350.1 anti-sigma regulatory factor [Nostoc sp. UCD121]MBC1295585.1 anti-sigma regulatory factor [Nostoc sp. UCD122]